MSKQVFEPSTEHPQGAKSGAKPYVNVLAQHSKSVAHVPAAAVAKLSNSKVEISTFAQSAHDSLGSISQSQNRANQLKVMKKLLKSYQKRVVGPAREKSHQKKRRAHATTSREGRSLSPPSAEKKLPQPSLILQSRLAAAQSQKEWKEQKKRVRELRQQRKAIEAKTREIKLKSMRHQQ